MKSLTSPRSDKFFAGLWLVFHALAILPFVFKVASSRELNIDADLFNMLPKPEIGKAMGVADEKLTELTGQNIFLLVSHEDFARAKETAEEVYARLKDSPRFDSVSLYSDMSMLSQVTDFVNEYRWNLLGESDIARLSTDDGARAFADNALAQAYGAFTISSMQNVETDPFMLGERSLQNYLAALQQSGTAMSPKDNVLAALHDGKWYVMIRASLSKAGSALASKTNGVAQIYDVCNPLEKDGVRFVYSGTPVHSFDSSSSAINEISVISSVTLLALAIILLFVFKSPLPIFMSLGSILISLATAFSVSYLMFGKIHVLTLVFGTSLIGSCIDYSLHFFINWKANRTLSSGREVRAHLMKGLFMSLVSTELCYFILVFAPFDLLKQMATFSLFGILSSFLTVAGAYPLLKMPAQKNRSIPIVEKFKRSEWRGKKRASAIVTAAFFVLTLGTIVIRRDHVRIKNDVGHLYTPKGRMAEDSVLCVQVTKYYPTGWFIVAGDSAEETLEREEALRARLEAANANEELDGYIATTQYIPSIAKQKRSRAAAKNLLPLAQEQLDALGFDGQSAGDVAAAYDASDGRFITPQSDIPASLRDAIASTWLGEIDGRYYSIVLPASITSEEAYDKAAAADPNIYFEKKIRDIGRDLDRLTRAILMLFAIAYVVIVVVIKFFYSWRQTLKIASIPALIVLVITSVFAARGIDLEFFSITGMILVFGLGLDYIIYMIENEKRGGAGDESKLEPFAILLSFLTTVLSFGALSLSGFVPVHMLGLSIFLGLATAFVCTIL